jgi:hypothetical protein
MEKIILRTTSGANKTDAGSQVFRRNPFKQQLYNETCKQCNLINLLFNSHLSAVQVMNFKLAGINYCRFIV